MAFPKPVFTNHANRLWKAVFNPQNPNRKAKNMTTIFNNAEKILQAQANSGESYSQALLMAYMADHLSFKTKEIQEMRQYYTQCLYENSVQEDAITENAPDIVM